jgi:hypothetical protein
VAAQQGYCTAQSGLGEVISPHAIDVAAYHDEGRRFAAAMTDIEAVERALRGEPLGASGASHERRRDE